MDDSVAPGNDMVLKSSMDPVYATNQNGSSTSMVVSPTEEALCNHGSSRAVKEDENDYPTGAKRAVILVSMGISTFLVALDNTIIGTAIPKITDQFKALDDVAWYGSAYLFTLCTFTLFFGKLFTLFPIKWVFIISLGIFELGSAISGAAPTSATLIVGRAIAGIGAAGNFSGLNTTIAHIVPLAKRPAYEGLVGSSWAIASVIGPLVGGAFTDHVSWRWCFYINLPIGAAVAAVLVFTFNIQKKIDDGYAVKTWRQILWGLDPIGTLTLIPCIVCLLLALQWGGTKYAWGNARIIVLFVIAGLLLPTWVAIQVWMGKDATVPIHIVKQRSIAAGIWIELCLGAVLYVFAYYLPIWFQAIKGASAWQSGIRIIPMLLGMVVSSIITGITITVILGYYVLPMIFGSIVMSVGAGLITTFKPSTQHPKWIGYQVLLGIGVGMGVQQPIVAAQAVLKLQDVPIASALLFLMQSIGGAIFLAVANNVLLNKLISGLAGVPGVPDPRVVLSTGATDLRLSPAVIEVYNHALSNTFYVPTAMAALSIFGSCALEWRNIRTQQPVATMDNAEESQTRDVVEKQDGPIPS